MVSHDLCIFFGDVCLLIHLYYFFDTMPTEDRNRHKICHCTEDCNRLLGLAQRKNHYRLVGDPSTICRSTTPSDLSDVSDDNGLSDSLENGSTEAMDIDKPQDHDSVDIEEMYGAENDHFEIGQEAGDGFYDGSDGEDWEFDPMAGHYSHRMKCKRHSKMKWVLKWTCRCGTFMSFMAHIFSSNS
jgi:hypothetical protein